MPPGSKCAGALALLAGSLLLGCRSQEGSKVPETEPSFAGRQVCESCHPEQTSLWRGSHHDLAMQEATDATVLGDFDDASFTYAGVTSRFFRRSGKLVARTDGPDGELHDYEVAYTFGVEPLQQYLIRFPGGRLQALSIAWDARPQTEGGQRWFHLYPDEGIDHEDPLHWTGLLQNWNHTCAECHSTGLEKRYLVGEKRFDTRWFEIDVSCEACHGPGSVHVARARAVAAGERPAADAGTGLPVSLGSPVGSWIFDMERGIAQRSPPLVSRAELETCAPCHSRREQMREEDLPGEPLLSAYRPALLREGLYFPDGQILGEVYVWGSFLQSRMYRAGVTCSDCHDPHSLDVRVSADGVCATCHLRERFEARSHHHHAPDSPGARCVECHMPSRTYMGVDPRRDHGFRIPRPDLTETLGVPNGCTSCHRDRSAAWAAAAVTRWFGPERRPHYGSALAAGRAGAPGAARALKLVADDAELPGIVRGTAIELLGRIATPESLGAIRRGLADPEPLVRLGAVEALEGLDPGARSVLGTPALSDPMRAVRVGAARILGATARAGAGSPALEAALEEYRAAQLFNADRPEAHMNLGVLHAQRGEASAAEVEYESALELGPWLLPAYINLADLRRMQGRDADGERLLRRALELSPDDPDVLHSLGLLLVRSRRLEEAIECLAAAAERAPDVPRYAYVYGVALQSAGRVDRALEVLEAAHERHPENVEVLQALATISRDAGSIDSALGYARRLAELVPGDPGARALLRQLEAARD